MLPRGDETRHTGRMTVQGLTVFDTPIGHCGLAWNGATVLGSTLPARDRDGTRAVLGGRFPHATEQRPPAWVQDTVERIVSLLRGEPVTLSSVPLDSSDVSAFQRTVHELTRAIPTGGTRTYGGIAIEIGRPGSARAVGRALGENPFPIIVPCHRVLAADGNTGGFSADGGTRLKRRILEIEGATEQALFDP